MLELIKQLKVELASATDAEKRALLDLLMPDGLYPVSDSLMEYWRQSLFLQTHHIERECIDYRGARWEPTSQIRQKHNDEKRAKKARQP